MKTFTPIDLSKLPSPDLVENIDYKDIFAQSVNRLRALDPEYSALVESDPAMMLLEVAAYREMLIRQRVNDAARGVMLAYATGGDLDQLGALFGVLRKVVRQEDAQAFPPVSQILESDEDFRYRITLALEGLSTAGPEGSYLYHTLKCPGVRDASIVGPPLVAPGQVLVTILSHASDGTADEKMIDEVKKALNSENVRPITDEVIVKPAVIQRFKIRATLFTHAGPDSQVVLAQARKTSQEFVDSHFRVGRDIPISGIYAALHVTGVQRVLLHEPLETLLIDHTAAPFCETISLTYGGIGE